MSPAQVNPSWSLFLDRDGVLNRKIENGYVLNPAMLEILPGVPQALAALCRRFGTVVVITNQRGIARGVMTQEQLGQVHGLLAEAVAREGGRIDAFFTCPHDVPEGCNCRKPRPGLALMAKERFAAIDFGRSVLVGDSDSDVDLGKALGMVTVRIRQQAADPADELAFASLLEFSHWMSEGAR